jgi:hypothetical protein
MSVDYRVACLPCNDAATINECPCAHEGGSCPHPLFHLDFASQCVRDRGALSSEPRLSEAEQG